MYRIYICIEYIYICICIDICKEYICMKICMFRYMYKYTCIEYMYRNVYAYRYIGVYRYICVYRYMYNAYTGVFSSQNLRRSFREKRIHRICSYLCVCMWSACCSKALERNIRCRYAPMPVQCAGVEVWSHCPLAKVRASCSGLHSNTSVAEHVQGGGRAAGRNLQRVWDFLDAKVRDGSFKPLFPWEPLMRQAQAFFSATYDQTQ